ncbi:MAG TPA: hypothetical protein VGR95_16650 [Thermoanaerobaculia bacterium]|nr:hypothetical protein [Thermoanaerobaculia bacterium]
MSNPDIPRAPLPVAYWPQSLTVQINGREMRFTYVDLNVWFAEALEAIEAASDERLEAARESLAKSIEATLVPIDAALPPLRELQFPPAVTSQTAEATTRPHTDPSALALWDYSFTYDALPELQDEVIAYVAPHTIACVETTAPDDERLFRALARFIVLHEEASPDLFVEMANEVAAAFAEHRPAPPPADVAGRGENLRATFNVFTTRSATAVVQVVRNRAAEKFRFIAETAASAEAPRLSHVSFDLGTLSGETLEDRLSAFFRLLISSGSATARLTAGYRDGIGQIPITPALEGDPLDASWTAQVAKGIRAWFDAQRPELGAQSAITFDVTVSVDEVAVIDVRDLYIDANRVLQSAGEAAGAPLRND